MAITPNFSPKQLEVYNNFTARLVFLVGAIRSGKTFVGYFMFLKELLRIIQTNSPGDVVIVGKTERTVLRNIINPMFEMLGPKYMRYIRGTQELYLFGKRVYIIGMNDERAGDKIRGMTVVLVFGDEITLWPEAGFTELLGRMSVPGAKFIGTTNPDSPFHWFKRNFLDRNKDANIDEKDKLDLEMHHFTLNDNTTLTDKYKEDISKEFTGVFYRRFILGEWCVAEGLIYDMFDEIINTYPNDYYPPDPPVNEFSISIDYGTGNPTRFGLFGHHKKTDCDFMLREYNYDSSKERRQKSNVEYKQDLIAFVNEYNGQMLDKYGERVHIRDDENGPVYKLVPTEAYLLHKCPDAHKLKIYVDPSAASFIAELMSNSCGVRFTNIIKANNKVVDGIRYVQTRLTQRKLIINSEYCPCALEEFMTYAWDEKAMLKGEDKPIKLKDHSMDMIRYYCYTRAVPRGGPAKIVRRTRQ